MHALTLDSMLGMDYIGDAIVAAIDPSDVRNLRLAYRGASRMPTVYRGLKTARLELPVTAEEMADFTESVPRLAAFHKRLTDVSRLVLDFHWQHPDGPSAEEKSLWRLPWIQLYDQAFVLELYTQALELYTQALLQDAGAAGALLNVTTVCLRFQTDRNSGAISAHFLLEALRRLRLPRLNTVELFATGEEMFKPPPDLQRTADVWHDTRVTTIRAKTLSRDLLKALGRAFPCVKSLESFCNESPPRDLPHLEYIDLPHLEYIEKVFLNEFRMGPQDSVVPHPNVRRIDVLMGSARNARKCFPGLSSISSGVLTMPIYDPELVAWSSRIWNHPDCDVRVCVAEVQGQMPLGTQRSILHGARKVALFQFGSFCDPLAFVEALKTVPDAEDMLATLTIDDDGTCPRPDQAGRVVEAAFLKYAGMCQTHCPRLGRIKLTVCVVGSFCIMRALTQGGDDAVKARFDAMRESVVKGLEPTALKHVALGVSSGGMPGCVRLRGETVDAAGHKMQWAVGMRFRE